MTKTQVLALLKEHAARTGYDFSGLTDIRTALRLASQVHQKKAPLRVALFGAFGGTGLVLDEFPDQRTPAKGTSTRGRRRAPISQ